jgi:UDP-N-acetylmuramate--alanine ligase
VADADLPDLSRPRRVHIVGIGGSGMSAIAIVLAGMGHQVSGTDAAASPVLDRLVAAGIEARVGHDPSSLVQADMVAVSTAIPPTDVEVVAALARGLRVWRRGEVLAAICGERRCVAVAGTHGKTSTSSMLAVILRSAGWSPSYIIGGDLVGPERGAGPAAAGARWDPAGEWMVVEADESDGTFLQLGAEATIVTSVEPDHLDFYGGEEPMRRAFERFVCSAPGPNVVCADDAGSASLAGAAAGVRTYGTSAGADVRIQAVELGRLRSTFWLHEAGGAGRAAGPFELAVPGLYNVRNAAAALTTARFLGIGWETAGAGLATYRGVARRFEVRGERQGVTYIDDYAHLPGEVAPVLAAAAGGGWSRVVAVFQPHRYSRTEALGERFADSFRDADILLVTDIYPAGEAPRPGVTGERVADAVRRAHPDADVRYVATLDEAATELRSLLRPGDLCLTLGAGDLTQLPGRMLVDD